MSALKIKDGRQVRVEILRVQRASIVGGEENFSLY